MTTSSQIESPPVAAEFAAHSWREFIEGRTYGSSLACRDSQRHIAFGTKVLRDRVRHSPDIGGLLCWNKTKDPEHGSLVMIAGQTVDQEHWVIRNAEWLVSCGAVYSASRVGTKFKETAGHAFTDGAGDRWICWLLWNDREVSSLSSHNDYLSKVRR